MTNREIFDMLTGIGMTDEGACGLMGNFMAESGMRANNAQDSFQSSGGFTDEEYTAQVDAGQRAFIDDDVGYGYAQWTLKARKMQLLEYARKTGRSIGDPLMQIQFCIIELQRDFPSVYLQLVTSHDIDACSDLVCEVYENPDVKNYGDRRKFARQFYNEFRGSGALTAEHQALYPQKQNEADAQAETPSTFWDWKIAMIQFCMQHDGYWGKPDGLKSAEFFSALDQYVADMKLC